MYYESVTKDNADFSDGLARYLRGSGGSAAGKIAVWAWAAMRVMDYLQTLPTVDKKNIGVAGHSRLGKTALVTAAYDRRFAFVHSNGSGACGAALFSLVNESAEHISDLFFRFPYWFCDNFRKYEGKERELPYDQDELLGLIAPRCLSVGSAEQDLWVNPAAEHACAAKASVKWQEKGCTGLKTPEKVEVGRNYHDGKVGYYVRKGTHYWSREDWARTLSFFDKNLNR